MAANTFEFYDKRAREAAADAEKAELDNVRDQALRAEATWRSLAEQAQTVAIGRQKAEDERAARRAEAEAEAG